jgi:adenosylhomocysteine nucleosidase
MNPIAFICAMPMELTPLTRKLALHEVERDGLTMSEGTLGDREVVAIVTGMGPDFARTGTSRLLDAVTPAWVLSVGITGALENETPIGTLIRPERVVDGATGREHEPAPLGPGTPHGKMWTTNGLTTKTDDLSRLRGMGIVSLDMETSAIADVCEGRNIPWSVFRVISDRASDGSIDQEVFEMSNMDGTPNRENIEKYFREHPEKAAVMAELGKQATAAADAAADAAIAACAHIPK